MNISSTYLLNVALHGAVLSILAAVVMAFLRQPRQRSFAAIAGLLAVGILPWITALRPEQPVSPPLSEVEPKAAPALPTWTVVTLSAPQENQAAHPGTPVAAPAKFVFPDPLPFIVPIWAAGTVACILLLGCALLNVRLWRRSLLPLDDSAWQMLQSLRSDIPGRHCFCLSKTTASPCVTGFFRPRIVLPCFLMEAGSEAGLCWAVRHEIAHWQAGDSRWMIFFTLIRCTNWWNPLVHQLVSRWAEAREQLCDLHATGLSESRADYGEFLVAMARRITRQPPLAVAMAKRRHAGQLKRRIVCLLGSGVDTGKPLGKGFIGIGSALFVTGAFLVSALRIGAEETHDVPDQVTDVEPALEPAGSTPLLNPPLPPGPANRPKRDPP